MSVSYDEGGTDMREELLKYKGTEKEGIFVIGFVQFQHEDCRFSDRKRL